MKFSEIKLPSNKKFGLFFTGGFIIIALYFLMKNLVFLFFLFLFISLIFFTLAIFRSKWLTYPNKVWMWLGFVLGIFISPIVLGTIFFIIFTPISIILKAFKRDLLQLKMTNKSTFWKKRNINYSLMTEFKNQF